LSDESAGPLALSEGATLSLTVIQLRSAAASEGLEKTLRVSRTAPMPSARRGMVPRTLSPAFQVQWLCSKKGRLRLAARLLAPFVFWHPVLSCAEAGSTRVPRPTTINAVTQCVIAEWGIGRAGAACVPVFQNIMTVPFLAPETLRCLRKTYGPHARTMEVGRSQHLMTKSQNSLAFGDEFAP
jgi:hypothetical protein